MNNIDINSLSVEELRALIAAQKAENDALRAAKEKGLSIKVSEKGAVSVYGLGRFPVTLYAEQWTRLLNAEHVKLVSDFIAAGLANGSLKPKAEKEAEAKAQPKAA